MSSQQSNIYNLLGKLEEALDKGFPLLSSMVVVKRDVVETLLDNIYASLPTEVQDARMLLRRRDDIQHEAQQRAEKIIREAQDEAQRMLSKSYIVQKAQRDCQQLQEQVIADCEAMKRKAIEEAEAIRAQARDEVLRTKEGINVFAEQILTNIEQNINQMQQIVKGSQMQLEKQRSEISGSMYNTNQNVGIEIPPDVTRVS